MVEEIKTTEIPEVTEVIEEIKSANEDTLKETISKWYETTRTDGMRIGAKYISLGVYAAIQKHTSKHGKVSMRDYERMVKDIMNLLDVQLKPKNNTKENKNDRTAEEYSESNS